MWQTFIQNSSAITLSRPNDSVILTLIPFECTFIENKSKFSLSLYKKQEFVTYVVIYIATANYLESFKDARTHLR